MPDTENPAKPPTDTTKEGTATPVELTEAEYHEVADHYLDHVLVKLEEIQDQADEIDVEFSVSPSFAPSLYLQLSVANKHVIVGRHDDSGAREGHLCTQQTASQQTNMALFTNLWPKEVRLVHFWRQSGR